VDDERVALLTGAGGRLGASFCRLYGARYRIVAVHGARPPPEGAALSLRADLRRPEECARAVDAALQRFGRIDVIVSNAVQYVLQPLLDERTLGTLQDQFALNVFAPLRLVAEAVRRSWQGREAENRARRRCVVHVSSLSGRVVYANRGQGAYAAAKAALDMLTMHLAAELGPLGVRANALAPNAFPRIVPTEAVAAGIARLDEQGETGRVLILDKGGERFA
jgi:NAD(P)-dependent dehydrogenase (short-subunit alcohol dehydrogenase family)